MALQNKIIRQTLDHSLRQFDIQHVAVYARVSRDGEVKHHSIEAQKKFLQEYIDQHPDWEFVDFYVDEGVTGTKLDRPELNRMMRDAHDGKIDIILTKAVSRFGRNTSAVLRMLQELRELGVAVIFDNEHVSTADPEGMFYLQSLCVMAEAEARQNSEYQKWAIRNRYKEGIPNTFHPYGYKLIDHELQVIPEEAEVVRKIYELYLSGMGIQSISKALNKDGIPSRDGALWRDSTVYRILHNEVYVGDLLLQKTYICDYLSKKKKPNQGNLPQYLVTGCHEAIIDQDTYDKVQAETLRRKKLYNTENRARPQEERVFSKLIYCEHCNKALHYKLALGASKRKMWICKVHHSLGADYCPLKPIREDILLETTSEVLLSQKLIKNDTELTNKLLRKYVSKIVAKANQKLEYHLVSGEVITRKWQHRSRSESWTKEMREKARERALSRKHTGKEVF